MAGSRQREGVVLHEASALHVANGKQAGNGLHVVVEHASIVVGYEAAHGNEQSHAAHIFHRRVLEHIVGDRVEGRIDHGEHLLRRLAEVLIDSFFAQLVVARDRCG